MIPKINHLLKDEQGITLVEVLMAITLSSILLTTIGSLYVFSFRTFNEVQELTNNQHKIYSIHSYIQRDLRNATEINILSSLPSPVDNSYNYIYMENGSVFILDNDTKSIANDIDSLNFEVIENTRSNNFYQFSLKYTINNENETTLILNNIGEYHSGQNESIIQYKTP